MILMGVQHLPTLFWELIFFSFRGLKIIPKNEGKRR